MKLFNEMYNVGRAKYVINFHDGTKKHPDGSNFYDMEIFKSQKAQLAFTKNLISSGYIYGHG